MPVCFLGSVAKKFMKKSFWLLIGFSVGLSAIVGMAFLRGKAERSTESATIHPAVQNSAATLDLDSGPRAPSDPRPLPSPAQVIATTTGPITTGMQTSAPVVPSPVVPSPIVGKDPQAPQSVRPPQNTSTYVTSGASFSTQSGGTFSTTSTPPPSNTVTQQVVPGSTTTLEAETPVWELPPGVKAPAAFYETGENGNPATMAANEQIAQSFEEEVLSESSSTSEGETETSSGNWNAAVKRADELYRTLFGDAAYNSRGLQSAADAQSSLQTTGNTNGY